MNSRSMYAVRLALIVSMGGFIFGFDASIISGAVPFLLEDFGLSDWELGLVVAAPTLGGIISGALAGPLSDRFGRKSLLLTVAILYAGSAMFSVLAPNYETLVIARFIGGLGFGSLGLAPIYIAEISPSNVRGRMISINQFNIVIGFSAAYFSNYGLLTLAQSASPLVEQWQLNTETWRWMLGIELIPAFLWVLLLFGIPESPRWMALNRCPIKAGKTLSKLIPESEIATTLKDLARDEQCYNEPLIHRLKGLFSPAFKGILLIGLLLAIAQQITGINAVYFYAPTIFAESGVGTNAAFAQAAMVGVINVVFTIIAMVLVDNVGRRPLLLAGMIGIAVSMLLCSYGFYDASYYLNFAETSSILNAHSIDLGLLTDRAFASEPEFAAALESVLPSPITESVRLEIVQQAFHANAHLVLLGILGFVASFAMSLGPIMWIMLPEIFPNHLRGVGMGVTGIINALVSFGIQLIFPWEINTIGPALTFFIYGVAAVVFVIILFKVLPETKGRSLENKLFSNTNDSNHSTHHHSTHHHSTHHHKETPYGQ